MLFTLPDSVNKINASINSDKDNKNFVYRPYKNLHIQIILVNKMICNKDKFLILKTYIKNHMNNKM